MYAIFPSLSYFIPGRVLSVLNEFYHLSNVANKTAVAIRSIESVDKKILRKYYNYLYFLKSQIYRF